jgi:two-component system, OmpR family, phosphate regulon sensor histidine kinase PhoR
MMFWFLLCAIVGSTIALVYAVWRSWIVPWRRIEEMIRQIAHGGTPHTFLVEGGPVPRRVGLALEDLFSRQQQLDQQITERASGTETIFAAMQDGLLVTDTHHRITLVNKTFAQLFGLRENYVSWPLLETVRDPALDRLIAETLRTGAPQRSELTIPDLQNEALRRMQLSAVAMKNSSGVATGAVVLFHDITQLKRTDEIRRDFVANVSHELRTPLSILHGYIETLLDDPKTSPDQLTRILEVMKKHSDRLSALVNDLLTLAHLESTNPNLQLSDLRLSEFFAAIVRDWAKKFAEKKLSIDISVASDLPTIRADEARLQEVLYNLLDNTLKYSRPGGKVRLQAQKRGDEIALTVSDTGVGISGTDLPRIFERFYRADKGRSRELGGTGLGLSIVKHIAQMHGGRVEAESELGRGTTIRVMFPVNGTADQLPKSPVTET